MYVFMPDHLRLQEAEYEAVSWGLCLLAMRGERHPCNLNNLAH